MFAVYMWKIPFTGFLLALVTSASLFGAHPVFSRYPAEMEEAVEAISALPEARPLLDAVHREGKVEVASQNLYNGQFSAFWVGGSRRICVSNGNRLSKGAKIRSILFELHNARANQKIAQLDQKARQKGISRAQFVEGTERIEYQNVLDAKALLQRGVERGLFPRDCHWPMPERFDDYFAAQKRAGHSAWIGRKYDRLTT